MADKKDEGGYDIMGVNPVWVLGFGVEFESSLGRDIACEP